MDYEDPKEIEASRGTLLERLEKAGWTSGPSIATAQSMRLLFTPKGVERMKQLIAMATDPAGKNPAAMQQTEALILSELEPPALTPGEKYEFVEIYIAYRNQNPPNDCVILKLPTA